jgi:hypothetical protein
MLNKGQVTIFVIISIFLVIAIVLFFIFKDNITNKKIPQEISPFYTNLISCLEQTSQEGIYYLAAHGGYYHAPANSSIIYFLDEIPYYYLNNQTIVPELNIIERELEIYVSENLENCLSLNKFRSQGFKIDAEPYIISANMFQDSIFVRILSSIIVSKEKNTLMLKNSEVNLKNNFNEIYEASIEVVNSYSQKPGLICLTCLDQIIEKYDVDIQVLPVNDISVSNNDIIWYLITDKQDKSEDKLKLIFVVEK